MKLSLLPEFNMKPDAEELAYKHAPLYTGQNKYAAFVLNRTFYILAFLIPLLTMLFLMNHFGYAPFGDKCMFVLDGAYINLPVLNGMIHDLQEGTFHLYTLKGSMGSEFFSSIAYYLSSPFTLICLFFSQKTAVILLSLFSVVRISLSGAFFLYYLTHRKLGRTGSPYDPMMLILSLGYALSSYALVQYNDFMFLDHFMLFPILLLFLEEFMVSGTWKKLAFLNAFLLFSNFYLGIILNIFLLLYYFLKNKNSITVVVHHFGKLTLSFLFSCALSAITVIPGICAFISNCQTSYMQLDTKHLQGDYYAFFLRHLFNATPSFYDVAYSGLNLYFGLFAVLLAVLYFFCKDYSLQLKVKHGIFVTILIMTFCSKQFSFLIHLLSQNDSAFCSFTFVYIAFVLTIAGDVLPYIRTISLPRIVIAIIIPIVLSLLSLSLVGVKPNYDSVYFSFAIILAYGILLLLYRIGSIKRDSFFSLVLCISCLELLANAYQTSFCVSKENTTMEEVIITNGITCTEEEDVFLHAEMPNSAEYSYQLNLNSRFGFNRMYTKSQGHFRYTPLEDSLNGLHYAYITKGEALKTLNPHQYTKYSTTDVYDIFENTTVFPSAFALSGTIDESQTDSSTFISEQNSIAKTLGSYEDIYTETTPENVHITLPTNNNLEISDLGNQVFSIARQDEDEDSLAVYPTVHFTPTADGSLYIILHGNPIHFGDVKAGTEYSHSFSAEISDTHNTVMWIQFCYYNDNVLQNLSAHVRENTCRISYDGSHYISIKADVDTDSTIFTNLPFDSALKLAPNTASDISLASYHDKLTIHVPAGAHTIKLDYTYTPFIFGCLFSLLTLICYSFVPFLSKKKTFVADFYQKCILHFNTMLDKGIHFISENQIYFLAFLIPLGCYLLIMIFCGCEPFGVYSIFNGDGPAMTLPTMYQISNLLKDGFPAHSWYGGGGFNSSNYIQFSPLELLLYFVPNDKIILYTTYLVILSLCLCGPSIVFYLTHRLTGKKAYKKDYRLLVPAMCYSFCNYSLLFINNTSWYYALILLPLILLGMDYLMIKKKSRYYILALGASLLLQYYLTMFICFFLVIHFFTYRFKNVLDFIKKGIRFALSSLITGLLSFSSLYYGLMGFSGNTYSRDDSVFPTSYLFHGFEYLFNRQTIFAETYIISWDEGNANLYFGILTLLLLTIYLMLKIPWREKLRLLIPYAIFFFALNHSVLNYIFNGFHYQHGVPNRFAFLVVILASFISYDCIRLLKKTPRKKIVIGTLGLIILFTISYFIAESDSRNSIRLIATLICLIVYMIHLCKPFRKKITAKQQSKILVALFILELFVNAAYQVHTHTATTYYVTNMDPAISAANSELGMENTLDHIAVCAPVGDNHSYVSRAKTNNLFSVSLTENQLNYTTYLGYFSSPNIVKNPNTLTPFGYALGNIRYLLLNIKSVTQNMEDIKYHTPIALYDNTIIYENKRCFPFAYYLPDSVSTLMNRPLLQQELWNEMTSLVLNTREMVQYAQLIENYTAKNATAHPEKNYYVAVGDKVEEDSYYDYELHVTVPRSGSVYTKFVDYQYLGEFQEGDCIDVTLDGSTLFSNRTDPEELTDALLFVLDNELITELNAKINEHPFQVTSFTNDTILGTIDMPEDGYVNFTMPYDERWHVLIDGKETKTESLGNGFLTIRAEKGFHEISLDYIDNRSTPVVLITIFSWIGFFVICTVKDKLGKRRKKDDL